MAREGQVAAKRWRRRSASAVRCNAALASVALPTLLPSSQTDMLAVHLQCSGSAPPWSHRCQVGGGVGGKQCHEDEARKVHQDDDEGGGEAAALWIFNLWQEGANYC